MDEFQNYFYGYNSNNDVDLPLHDPSIRAVPAGRDVYAEPGLKQSVRSKKVVKFELD